MTAPVLLTDDLTRQVHVVPERLTKACRQEWGWFARGKPHPDQCACGGSGRVPVEVGDTLELRRECPKCGGAGCEEGCGLRGGCEKAFAGPNSHRICRNCSGFGAVVRSAPVVWDGPAAKIREERQLTEHWSIERSPGGRWLLAYDGGLPGTGADYDLDALGIGSDPDQWVYLVSNSSGSTSNASDTATK